MRNISTKRLKIAVNVPDNVKQNDLLSVFPALLLFLSHSAILQFNASAEIKRRSKHFVPL